MTDQISYPDFRDNWLDEALRDAANSTEKGRAFSLRIVRQWLGLGEDDDCDDDSDDLFYCDGAGDGGIDLAFLKRGEQSGGEQSGEPDGDTWYLVQSKYGTAFQGDNTLIAEGRKVIDTLAGSRDSLSSLSGQVVERLRNFLKARGENDRLVLIFATVDPLDEGEKQALEDVRSIARDRLGFNLEVEAVSLHTIFSRTGEGEETQPATGHRICVELPFEIPNARQNAQLLVGTVTLPDIYQFLSDYRKERDGDLELLYARNVRVFLGGKGKVNKAIAATLEETPQLFGFYNNGITIVVSDFHQEERGVLQVCEPSVVNGCQTTRSIWEVFEKKTKSGGTGQDRELVDWMGRAHQGTVIVKIVRVSDFGNTELLSKITRYTNSQNAVKDQDFLALESGFKAWQDELKKARIYLEIQRGGSDAQKAKQKNKIKFDYDEFVNAFDLFKVYGAGWLKEPGQAWNKNAAFLPNGEFFNEIVKAPFGATDLLECFYLHQGAAARHFGKRLKDQFLPRRLTRYLFFFVTLQLLRDLLLRAGFPNDRATCTRALKALRESPEGEWKALLDEATNIIDNYMKLGASNSVSKDPLFESQFGSNINSYLKSDHFAKTSEFSPGLWHYLDMIQFILSRPNGDAPSIEQRIDSVLQAALPTTLG